MKVVFLGTGTSHGVPVIGCSCAACSSKNKKNTRYRSSVFVSEGKKGVLIDTPAEFRLRAMEQGIKRIDALLFTHAHADHTAGLDDVRKYNELQGAAIPAYADRGTAAEIRRRFDYIFKTTQEGGGKPRLALRTFEPFTEFLAAGLRVTPLDVRHGCLRISGFRIGDFAYITDASKLPERTVEAVKGVRVLVLNALRLEKHPTHFNLEEALETAGRIGAKRTYFTHIAHGLEHVSTQKKLPPGIKLAYDGLIIEI